MKKKSYILITLTFLLSYSCVVQDINNRQQQEPTWEDLMPLSEGELVNHTYYSLSYNEKHEQANWVFYMLYSEIINGNTSRTDDFREDPLVSTGSASLEDYKGSGYDRGHLCPAGSMTMNKTSMSESFYLSNMVPQDPSCNRGKWKSLEDKVRDWVMKEDTLYIVTGPIFEDIIEKIGDNQVTVSGYFYKIIYDPTGTEKMIAFIMPNAKMDNDISFYATSVDEVEELTNIDFFPIFDDNLEDLLEQEAAFDEW
ncbi:DNA/RNA non-specific endonuclease [Candidatus Woesearchaeota archaeon]|nr:DNA/RNA non-specific endonuclease [Candidatus Woesearchaeota archaeon]